MKKTNHLSNRFKNDSNALKTSLAADNVFFSRRGTVFIQLLGTKMKALFKSGSARMISVTKYARSVIPFMRDEKALHLGEEKPEIIQMTPK